MRFAMCFAMRCNRLNATRYLDGLQHCLLPPSVKQALIPWGTLMAYAEETKSLATKFFHTLHTTRLDRCDQTCQTQKTRKQKTLKRYEEIIAGKTVSDSFKMLQKPKGDELVLRIASMILDVFPMFDVEVRQADGFVLSRLSLALLLWNSKPLRASR